MSRQSLGLGHCQLEDKSELSSTILSLGGRASNPHLTLVSRFHHLSPLLYLTILF